MAKINIEHSKNEDEMKLSISAMRRRLEKVHLGGGEKKLEKQRAKGKMTARERVDKLIDEGSYFMELGAFAAYDMYKEHGGCPSAGVITGLGHIQGRLAVIVSNLSLIHI